MRLANMPGCCSIEVIHQLSGTANCLQKVDDLTEEEIMKELDLYHNHLSIQFVTTNNEQVAANWALKRLGFDYSDWIPSPAHKTKVRLWWRPALPRIIKEFYNHDNYLI